MGAAGDRAHGDDASGAGRRLCAPGRRIDLAGVVAARLVHARRTGRRRARGPGGGPALQDRAASRAESGWSSARPDAVFSYVLEAGLPLRDYSAVVTLSPPPGHLHPLALHLPGQGPRQRLALPASAGQIHRPRPSKAGHRRPTGPRRRRGRSALESSPGCWRPPRRPGCSAPSRRTKARRSWERDSCRAGSASPRRPAQPSSRAPRPSMARRASNSMAGSGRDRWRPARRGRSSGWPPPPRPGCWPAGPAWRRPGRLRLLGAAGSVTSVSPKGSSVRGRRQPPSWGNARPTVSRGCSCWYCMQP